MTLINCPECNGQVSDKAEVCIHCGYPIKEYIDNTLIQEEKIKEVVLTNKEKVISLVKDGFKVQAIKEIQAQTNINVHDAIEYLESMGIIKQNNEITKKVYKQAPKVMKCPICDNNIYENVVKCPYCNSTSEKIKKTIEEKNKKQIENQVICPKCGSTQIQMVNRKWSLLTGFLTNKVDRVCMNCKHKF